MKTYQVPTTKERKPVLFWEVRQNGVPIFRNNSVKICQYWRTNNGFNAATLHAIR